MPSANDKDGTSASGESAGGATTVRRRALQSTGLVSAALIAAAAWVVAPSWAQDSADQNAGRSATIENADAQNLTDKAENTPEMNLSVVPASFADLAAKLSPAVVNIQTSQTVTASDYYGQEMPQLPEGSPFEDFFRDFFEHRGENGEGMPSQPRHANALGSGFVVDPSGYVVTNNHVIEGADEITVMFPNHAEYKAELVGVDDKTDIAVLKISAPEPLPYVEFGQSEGMRVGDWVLAIGNPFGLGGTVTAGIISAFGRNINAGPYDDFIQTDASINRGNSGGPMFNMQGQVIGINTAIFSPSGGSVGVGFAIPSHIAQPVVDQLREFGRTRRGWLGVRIQSVTDDIAESLGLDQAEGALVASVTPGGPAAEAGLQTGDVIVEFNDKPIGEMRELPREVAETAVDATVPVTVWRGGEEVDIQVKLGELEQAEDTGMLASIDQDEADEATGGDSQELSELGLTLGGLTGDLAEQYNLDPETKGVVITEVAADSQADEKGLKAGEIIVEVGQDEVSSPQDVQAKIEEAREAGRKSVLLLVQSEGDMRFVALNVERS